MPIQGTAADIIKVAMIRVDAELRERELRSRMILQVHDELIFECPADEVDAIRELATRIMPAGLEMNVPLKVDLKQGKNWGGMALKMRASSGGIGSSGFGGALSCRATRRNTSRRARNPPARPRPPERRHVPRARAGRAAGLPDPHHHRRPAQRHRH